MRITILLALILAAVSAGDTPAQQGRAARVESLSGTRWAVLVGVDSYKHVTPNLSYCGADVRALGDRLVQAGFNQDCVVVLSDKAGPSLYPSKANIEKQLRLTLESVGPNDFVFLGFSGHGVRLDGKSYLCPYDAKMDPDDLLPIDTIYKKLQDCPAKFKLFLVDACQNDTSMPKELVATRAANEVKQFDPFAADKLPIGILLMTSCSAGQKSVEEPKFGHGVFTYFLLEGLAGQADADRNGEVSLLEWSSYAASRTRAYVRSLDRAQSPAMRGEFPDFDFARVAGTHQQSTRSKPTIYTAWPFDEREAKRRQEETARAIGLPVEITNSIGMKFVLIPAGEFMMGSPDKEDGRFTSDERPLHRVRITQPFRLGVYEVTQEQYASTMGSKSSSDNGPNRPVDRVSWDAAVEFCRRLSEKEASTYRLPTEAEWEHACRAGTTTPFHFGTVLNGEQGNCDGSFPYGTRTTGPNRKATVVVGSYVPNAWGLYDMHGNVSEWCRDWFGERYYAESPVLDPTGPNSGERRVLRSGDYPMFPDLCRSASRLQSVPEYNSGGVRLLQVLAE